jgi:hypothetical protein
VRHSGSPTVDAIRWGEGILGNASLTSSKQSPDVTRSKAPGATGHKTAGEQVGRVELRHQKVNSANTDELANTTAGRPRIAPS